MILCIFELISSSEILIPEGENGEREKFKRFVFPNGKIGFDSIEVFNFWLFETCMYEKYFDLITIIIIVKILTLNYDYIITLLCSISYIDNNFHSLKQKNLSITWNCIVITPFLTKSRSELVENSDGCGS